MEAGWEASSGGIWRARFGIVSTSDGQLKQEKRRMNKKPFIPFIQELNNLYTTIYGRMKERKKQITRTRNHLKPFLSSRTG